MLYEVITKGTPQGGVISPLLANVYLHWFEKLFYTAGGPGSWAKARIVRYADDFVVLARHTGSRMCDFIESKIESWLGLELNRDKTKVVDLRCAGSSLDFLGFTFRYDRDRITSYNVCYTKLLREGISSFFIKDRAERNHPSKFCGSLFHSDEVS